MAVKKHFDIDSEENISHSSWPKKLREQYGTTISRQAKQFSYRMEKIKGLLRKDFEEAGLTQQQYLQALEQVQAVFDKNSRFLKAQLNIQIHMAKTEGTTTLYLLDQKIKENEAILQKLDILCDKLALIELENDQADVIDELDALIEQTRLYKESGDDMDFGL